MSNERICANCRMLRPIEAFNKCRACYVYERKHGVPRPAELFREKVTPAYFAEEWHHMTSIMGMPIHIAKQRLSEGLKLDPNTVTIYIAKQEKAAA